MPYNFEGTFVQPLLTKLDNGLIGGADDWADAITTGYVTTIKAGLPQGVPVTLPAPGLNPTAPPAFAIGAAGFNTADSRSKVMYNIVRAYFLAKEITLDKGSIESLVTTIKQLVAKIKARYQQVKALIEQITLITKELAALPQLIAEIIEDLRDFIKDEVENVKLIFNSLQEYEVILGPEQYRVVFASELRLITTIQNFDIKSVSGIRDISLFVAQYTEEAKRQRTANSDTDLMKRYVRQRLFGIAKLFLTFAEGIVDPTRLVGFLSAIASGREKVRRLLAKVTRFDFFIRYVRPQLRKLEAKKTQILNRIKTELRPKINQLKVKLADKTKELSNKLKINKAVELYGKASKNVNDLKKKNEQKIKKVKKYIALGVKGVNASANLVGKTITFVDGVKTEFTNLTKDIQQLQKNVNASVSQLRGIVPSPPTAPSIPSLPSGPLQLANTNFIQQQIAKQKRYFITAGLGEFGELGALVILQTKCDFQTFKQLFERRSDRIKAYALQIADIERSFDELSEIAAELRTGKPQQKKRREKSVATYVLNTRMKSLKDLLSFVVTRLRPKIAKIEQWIKDRVDEAKAYLTKVLVKFKDDLTIFAANLIPLKSDVQDIKDKAAVAQDKINKAKDKIAQLKKLIKLATHIARLTVGASGLGINLAGGKFKFTENESNIDNILEGWFGYRMEGQTQSVQAGLMIQKQAYRSDFEGLLIIELLITGLVETFKDIKNSEFVNDLKNFAANAKQNIPGRRSADALIGFMSQPPVNPLQWKSVAESLSLGVLDDISTQTQLLHLERKYLVRSREAIKKLCSIKRLQGTKVGKKLVKIKTYLDKNQSFILPALKLLAVELKRFFVFVYEKVIKRALEPIKRIIQRQKERLKARVQLELDKIKEKAVNIDAPIMSFTMALAARIFWTGATWQGPTGSTHLVLNIGEFKPIKAKSTDGASAMIREMAEGFELQLQTMFGLITPPANTGIPPIPFNGYK